MQSSQCIVIGQRFSLLVIRVQALFQCFHIIVAATNQCFTGNLIEIVINLVVQLQLNVFEFKRKKEKKKQLFVSLHHQSSFCSVDGILHDKNVRLMDELNGL